MSNDDNQKEQKVTNQYALFWNYNAHVEHQHNYYGGKPENTASAMAETKGEEDVEELPTCAEMAAVCEKTKAEGLWWADTSWSVVYQIYKQKGYKQSIDQFVEEVKEWPFKQVFDKKCNKDSVGKPARRGCIIWPLKKWREKGASKREIKLGERLMELLSHKKTT